MSGRRVVVTGLGMVAPVGLDVPSAWESILAGRSGIQPITHFDIEPFSVRFGGPIYGFDIEDYIPKKEARKMDAFIHYGIAAGTQAIQDSGIEITDANAKRIGVAIGSEAGFIARTVDIFQKHMAGVLRRAAGHRGASLVEIAQNCIIFNDGAWSHLTDPDKRLENVLYLEHGQPMRFGRQGEKGIRLNGLRPEVVDVAEVGEENLLVHDEQAAEPTLAYLLSRMGPPDFPTPVGVFRAIDKPVYSGLLMEQVHQAQAHTAPDLDALLVAENIAGQLERRISFSRAMKRAIQQAMRQGAEGVYVSE